MSTKTLEYGYHWQKQSRCGPETFQISGNCGLGSVDVFTPDAHTQLEKQTDIIHQLGLGLYK